MTLSRPLHPRWHRAGRAGVAAAAAAALALAGCGGGGAADAGDPDDILNLGMAGAPASLDPAQFNTAFNWFWDLAYDTLVTSGPDGTLQPGLATSWKYVGTDNRVFELTLRSGIKFSDGTDLTAEAVKTNLERAGQPGNTAATRWANKDITVTGPLSLRITSETPDPMMDYELTGNQAGGQLVSPAALKNPDQLGTATAGTGPYALVPNQTVPNDHYTYEPNPHYWNKDAIQYKKVVIKVIPNLNSVLNALKTGEVDAAPGDYTLAKSAQAAGLQVKYKPSLLLGLNLADRAGEKVPALADVRVRQALNYAVDRDTITKALFGDFAVTTEQTVLAGAEGSLDKPYYAYDPAKAKQLLQAAGFGGGLTVPVLTTTYNGQSQITQAIAADLAKVGVKLELTTQASYDQYTKDLRARKYPVASIGYGALPMYIEGPTLFLPNAATFNPFKISDPQIVDLYRQAAAAPADQRAGHYQQLQQRLVEQGWFVLVATAPKFYFGRSTVAGIDPPASRVLVNATWIRPSGQA